MIKKLIPIKDPKVLMYEDDEDGDQTLSRLRLFMT